MQNKSIYVLIFTPFTYKIRIVGTITNNVLA